jgi:hypothetical protein
VEVCRWFHPDTNGALPQAREQHAACCAGDNKDKMIVHGGFGGNGVLADIHILNLSTWTWSEVEYLPDPEPFRIIAWPNIYYYSILDIGYWILDIGYWLLDIGYWLLDIGYWILVIGYWLLVIGYWLLVIGYWILDIGYWLLDIGY